MLQLSPGGTEAVRRAGSPGLTGVVTNVMVTFEGGATTGATVITAAACVAVGSGVLDASAGPCGVGGAGVVDFVINVARDYDQYGRPDVYLIRRQAVDSGVPLVTDLQLARAIIEALRWRKPSSLEVLAWNDYVGRSPSSP